MNSSRFLSAATALLALSTPLCAQGKAESLEAAANDPTASIMSFRIQAFYSLDLHNPPEDSSFLQFRAALIAFGFGLLHGLGFASALAEIGLPEQDIPLALLAFNLGVEAGQLAFVFVVSTISLVLRWISAAWFHYWPFRRVLGYPIGCVAAFWLAERLSGF